MMKRSLNSLFVMALAATASAGTVTVDCVNNVVLDQTGSPLPCAAAPAQQSCTNLGITVAQPGDTLYLKGMCTTSGFTELNKSLTVTGDCGSGIQRVFNPAGGTAFRLHNGASDSVIEGITIKGNTNAVTNLTGPVANPDRITIRNSTLIALSLPTGGRCIQQFTGNGCAGAGCNRNDVNPCDPTKLETVSDHWVIENVTCESGEVGFLFSGNDFIVRNNYVKAVDRGISFQNNHLSPVSVALGGAASGAHRNLAEKNIVRVADIGAGNGEGLGVIEFGIDLFGGLTGVPQCDGVYGAANLWQHNCITAQDGGAAGSGLGMTTIAMKSTDMHHNSVLMYETPNPPSTGNGGIINFGSDHVHAEHNKIGGADIALQGAALGIEMGIHMNHNQIGAPTPSFAGTYAIVDNSTETNQYCGNNYCSSMLVDAANADVCAGSGPANHPLTSYCSLTVAKSCLPFTNSYPKTCDDGSDLAVASFASVSAPRSVVAGNGRRSLGRNRPVEVIQDWDVDASDAPEASGTGRTR